MPAAAWLSLSGILPGASPPDRKTGHKAYTAFSRLYKLCGSRTAKLAKEYNCFVQSRSRLGVPEHTHPEIKGQWIFVFLKMGNGDFFDLSIVLYIG